MHIKTYLCLVLLATGIHARAQRCSTVQYLQEQLKTDPGLQGRIMAADRSSQLTQPGNTLVSKEDGSTLITIPVVVHILYHLPSQKISDALVQSQIDVLNRSFRHLNADSVNTPSYFRSLAADCGIEFKLAISDPKKRYTTGILRKYTPIEQWKADDKMKFSISMGDDAWDASGYLNIWVCDLKGYAGYATFPGTDSAKDGVVIDFNAFGVNHSGNGYDLGKTAVHEIGHWLGLKHLWGDTYCGDDGIADTPKQAEGTIGCPTGIRITCNNAPNGDMYMNYMDFTNDGCTNLFTQGQKAKMRSLFDPDGPRYAILFSKGLNPPLIFESPLPEADPTWLHPQVYPDPATDQITLDLAYDPRWIGNNLRIINLQGQTVRIIQISSKIMRININNLPPGTYFIAAKRQDGLSIQSAFVKLY